MSAGSFGRLALVILVVIAMGAARAPDTVRAFDQEPAGRPPSGFSFRVARDPSPARWLVQREGTNGFLVHMGDASAKGGFSLAILDSPTPRRRRLVVCPHAAVERYGSMGILWRVQDRDNYYLARLDLSQQDIGLYRVVQGNRVRVEGEDDLELDATPGTR